MTMATMFVRHKVSDYDNWKRVYDEFASVRKEKGVTAASVHRDSNESDLIIVVHKFKDMNSAMAFANSEELKAAMEKAGVSDPPEIWFGEDIEQTPYLWKPIAWGMEFKPKEGREVGKGGGAV